MPFVNNKGLKYKKNSNPEQFEQLLNNYALIGSMPEAYDPVNSMMTKPAEAYASKNTGVTVPQEEQRNPLMDYAEMELMKSMKPIQKPETTGLGDVVEAISSGYKDTEGGTLKKILGGALGGVGEGIKFAGSSDGLALIGGIASLFNPDLGYSFTQEGRAQEGREQQVLKDYNEQEQARVKMLGDLLPQLGNLEINRDRLKEDTRQFDVSQKFNEDKFNKEFGLEEKKYSLMESEQKLNEMLAKFDMEYKTKQITLEEKKHKDNLALGWYEAQTGRQNADTTANNSNKETGKDIEGTVATTYALKEFTKTFDKIHDPGKETLGGIKVAEPFRMAGRFLSGGGNANEVAFESGKNSLLMNIARNYGGEKGPLTKDDLKIVEKYMPTISDSKVQKIEKMKTVVNLINGQLISKGYEPISVNEFINEPKTKNNSGIKSIKQVK
jgi:hypothetical protein